MQRDILGLCDELTARYGGLVRVPVPGNEIYLVADADMLHQILVESERTYVKGERNQLFAPLLGNGLVISGGSHWQRQRKLMNPHFSHQAVGEFEHHIRASLDETVADWQKNLGKEIDVNSQMEQLTFRALLRGLFSGEGQQHADALFRDFSVLSQFCIRRFFSPVTLPLRLSYALHPAARRSAAGMKARLLDIITKRRNAPRSDKPDLLGMLIEARDENGEGMRDEDICDEITTVFFAGYDTTSVSLTMTLRMLADQPDAWNRVAAEAKEKVNGAVPTAEEVRSFKLIASAYKEALRLYPPAYMINRTPLRDVELGGFPIPEGSLLLLSIWSVHRMPEYWDDPLQFRVDRFTEENRKEHYRHAYIPFSSGPRICLGIHLALLEAGMILGTLMKQFRLAPRPGHEPNVQAYSTLHVTGGMPMVVSEG